MKKKKNIFLFLGGIILVIIAVFGYLIVSDLKQEEILKQEIINVSNKDLLKSNYEIEVKTTGDYAYVEEAVKKFYKQLSDSVKIMNSSLNDENLINILSPANLEKDRPHFQQSFQLLDAAEAKTKEAINTIISLCNEEKIKNLLDKEKVDDYYIDLYQELMYTKKDIQTLNETKVEMEELSNNIDAFLKKVREILQMLERTNDSWQIEDNQIYFDNNQQVEEYNRLYNELNQIATEKFTQSDQNTNTNTSSSNV